MTTKSAFSIVGLMHKFGLAWEKSGGTVEELNRLAEDPDRLADLLAIVRLGIDVPRTISPYRPLTRPHGFEVESHIRCNADIDLAKTILGRFTVSGFFGRGDNGYVGNGYLVGERIVGLMRAQRPNMRLASAIVLDHLLENPIVIPGPWYGHVIWFFGSSYKDNEESIWIRGIDCRTKENVRECSRDLCRAIPDDLQIAFTEPY